MNFRAPPAVDSAVTSVPHEMIAGKVEERLGEEIEDRVGRQGTEVADDAGGGEPIFGGQHGIQIREPATFRRCGRSEEDRDGLQVGVGSYRRVHWDQDGS